MDSNNSTPKASRTDITEVDFSKTLGNKYLSYALSTITSRSLPDVRDGLKPVHRRILYAMLLLRLDPKNSYKKCARIVGDIIGKYHPHGDSAVYASLVRMAQDFASRYPIVDGQGNFGSIDGDNPAAMRYTEAKLTEYALLLLQDINNNAVDFRPNYDNSNDEPVILPAVVPNVLANGTEGIAVGMATSIPPHNIVELCEAAIKLVKSEDISISDLCENIKGPDFPTGGILLNSQASIQKIYETGRGSFRLRAKWHVENLERGTYKIIVTEIPYQVQKKALIEKMAALFNDKKLPFLESFQDMSAEDMQIIIFPKSRNIKPEQIMEYLFKLTDMEVKFHMNLNVLDSCSVPRVMNLKEVLSEFLEHRRVVVTRRSEHRLANINNRLEILSGLLIAYLNIDEVIKIIREEDDAKQIMMRKWNLTDVQAEAILNMKLRSLRKLEEVEINKEKKGLEEEKQELESLLASKTKLHKVIADELKKVIKHYQKDNLGLRKTEIMNDFDHDDLKVEEFVEKQPITFTCSQVGWLKTHKGHNTSNIKYKAGDSEWVKIECCISDKIILFSSFGKSYTLDCDKISGAKGDGDPLRLVLDVKPNEQIIAINKFNENDKYLLASNNGRGFIANAGNFLAQTKTGKQILNCDDNAAIVCSNIADNTHIAAVGENRRVLVFSIDEVPNLQRGKGVMLQKYKQGKMLDARLFNIDEGLKWQAGKRTHELKNLNLWMSKRASMGRIVLSKIWIDQK